MRSIILVALLSPLICFAANPTEELVSAAESGNTKLIQELVTKGASVNPKTKIGTTPLMMAVNYNKREAVKLLIKLGADPNLSDVAETSPLYVAVGRDTEIVRLLLDAGANPNYMPKIRPNSQYLTILGNAVCMRDSTFRNMRSYVGPFPNRVETVRLLIKAGADVNKPYKSLGAYPLQGAIRCGNPEIVHVLLAAGAKFNVMPGFTAIMDAIGSYSNYKSIEPVKMLLDFGADPNDHNSEPWDEFREEKNGCDWCGYTLVTYAAKRGYYDIVKLLLERGADPSVPRTDGVSAVELAMQNGHAQTAALIQKHLKLQNKSP